MADSMCSSSQSHELRFTFWEKDSNRFTTVLKLNHPKPYINNIVKMSSKSIKEALKEMNKETVD